MEEWQSLEGAVVADDLDVDTVGDDLAFLLQSVEVSLDVLGETELSGHEDLLAAWELELGSSQGLLGVFDVLGVASDGHQDLADVDSGTLAQGLSESTSHTLLQSIGTSARKHFVDSDDVPWVHSDSHVEVLSSDVDLHVLVASNTGSLESLGGDLLLLVANQMDAGGESVVLSLLLADIVHPQFGVWDTTIESRFWIRLVLLVAVAP